MASTSMLTEYSVAPLILKHRAILHRLNTSSDSLPPQPSAVGPVHDPIKARVPLAPFSQAVNDSVYGPSWHLESELEAPQQPQAFTDPYLYPTLTANEFIRLNAVWYYTKGLDKDDEMLKKLDRMLDLVKESLGWEIAIIGLVDATTYTRLVTANIDLATIPRRESTCSHTVNVEAGTVFTVTDMSHDWRFKKSPPVEVGGLRSYAGTQLRLPLNMGEDVALGSLCVASTTVQKPLTDQQKKVLVRASDLMMHELVVRTHMLKMKERQAMTVSLTKIRAEEDVTDYQEAVLNVVKTHYPDADVFITPKSSHQAALGGGITIPFVDFQNGVWEDRQFMNEIISQAGDSLPCVDRPVRALLGVIPANDCALIVATKDVKHVFDELDAWFIDQCGQVTSASLQARALREALAAKDKFLRTVTHELRTPIHGILSSVELLSNELKARQTSQAATADSLEESSTLLNSFLQTMRQSGTELMTTVNNILRLNSTTHTSTFPTDYDLRSLEADVLGEVMVIDPQGQLRGLSIRFEHHFRGPCTSVHVDADLLRECLKCLVFNAITATPHGTIGVCTSFRNNKLVINVTDNGCGIAPADRSRIFLPFEKVNPHSKGSGIGLNLAKHMAHTLGGDLTLVSSAVGQGSTFELVLPHVEPTSDTLMPLRQWSHHAGDLPKQFHIIRNSDQDIHLLDHLESHLRARGLTKSNTVDDCLVVMNRPVDGQDATLRPLKALVRSHLILTVQSCSTDREAKHHLREALHPHWAMPLTGPFFSSRLDEQLSQGCVSFREHKDKALELSQPMAALRLANSTATPPPTPSAEVDRGLIAPDVSRPLRALLVDDNDVNLAVLAFFCKQRKVPFGTAVNGNLAVSSFLASCSQQPYTLILLDLQMPECDGVEACKQIRAYEKTNGLTAAIIFIITGQDSVMDRRNCFEAGVDDFFVKPVGLKKLERAIAQYFPRSKS